MRSLRRLARDESGSAMVEFAFVLPIMVMLFIGVVEVTHLLRLDRKVVAAAQTTADLITQRRAVTTAQLNDVLRAAELILEPYSPAAQGVGIAGVRFDPNSGAPVLDWSRNQNGGGVPDALTLAQGLGQPGEGLVVVRVTYSYSPVFLDFMFNGTAIQETAVMRPRRSAFVQGPTS